MHEFSNLNMPQELLEGDELKGLLSSLMYHRCSKSEAVLLSAAWSGSQALHFPRLHLLNVLQSFVKSYACAYITLRFEEKYICKLPS